MATCFLDVGGNVLTNPDGSVVLDDTCCCAAPPVECPADCTLTQADVTFPAPYACNSGSYTFSIIDVDYWYVQLPAPNNGCTVVLGCDAAGRWVLSIGDIVNNCSGGTDTVFWQLAWTSAACPAGTYSVPCISGGTIADVSITFS